MALAGSRVVYKESCGIGVSGHVTHGRHLTPTARVRDPFY